MVIVSICIVLTWQGQNAKGSAKGSAKPDKADKPDKHDKPDKADKPDKHDRARMPKGVKKCTEWFLI